MSYKPFTKKDFIALLKQAVMFHPRSTDLDGKDLKCKRLNSFVWLENNAQIKQDNFGLTNKAKDKDYFFSRSGTHNLSYPALFLWEQGFTIENRFNTQNQPRKECSTFEIVVLDQYAENCKNCNACQKRTPHDLHCDTSELLSNALDYLCTVVCASVDGAEPIWASLTILEQMKAKGQITDFVVDKARTRLLQKSFSESTATISGSYYRSFSKKNLYGSFNTIRFCFSECKPCNPMWEDKGYNDEILHCC